MPYASANGIRLAYERTGHGERVLLIMGQAAGGNVWSMYQVPALESAGYEAITFDNRGVPPSDVPPGDYSLADLVADTTGLIEALGAGPCRLVGTSLGALVAAELAEAIPDCDYVEIGSCGHLGYLERPDQVNSTIIEFLDKN
jgi:pimeloyl-ACP methyl ester carboxylesterase